MSSISDYKQMLTKAMDKLRSVVKEAEQDVTIDAKDIQLAHEMLEKAKVTLETEKWMFLVGGRICPCLHATFWIKNVRTAWSQETL